MATHFARQTIRFQLYLLREEIDELNGQIMEIKQTTPNFSSKYPPPGYVELCQRRNENIVT